MHQKWRGDRCPNASKSGSRLACPTAFRASQGREPELDRPDLGARPARLETSGARLDDGHPTAALGRVKIVREARRLTWPDSIEHTRLCDEVPVADNAQRNQQ